MILRFPNYEAAALAATRLRDEGYFAEICDEVTPFFHGPMAMLGVRLVVSEEAVEGAYEEISIPAAEGELANFMRVGIFSLWGFFFIAAAVGLLHMFALNPIGLIIAIISTIALAAFYAVLLFLAAGFSMVCHSLLAGSVLRSDDKSWTSPMTLLTLLLAFL